MAFWNLTPTTIQPSNGNDTKMGLPMVSGRSLKDSNLDRPGRHPDGYGRRPDGSGRLRTAFSRTPLHWLNVNERIIYKLKVLTTNQPQYLHNLISVQPCRNTRSSSMVSLARPPTRSSLKISNRSFQYAAPCLWNELPTDLREPRQTQSPSLSPITHCHECILLLAVA